MISVDQALAQIFALVTPLEIEHVPLRHAAGRVLRQPVVAQRAQPPFAASAMDGYALRRAEIRPGATFRVVGEAPAGKSHPGQVGPGETVRIFTGAPIPDGADFVVIQEDTDRSEDVITLRDGIDDGDNIRPAGGDFEPGAQIDAPLMLRPGDVALAAAMNAATLPVTRQPVVAVLATGDELVMPGETPGPDQIIASNSFGLCAMFEAAGAQTRLLPIARDTPDSLRTAIELARGADLLITIGGASVGDHDLVGPVARDLGMEQSFYKVAMRPGKPLMAGRVLGMPIIGLPGNPVSSMVCGQVFIVPAIRAMLGLGASAAPRQTARLAIDLPANGPREHYMRAVLNGDQVTPAARQDSSLLTVLAGADVLMIRPVADGPRQAGDVMEIITL